MNAELIALAEHLRVSALTDDWPTFDADHAKLLAALRAMAEQKPVKEVVVWNPDDIGSTIRRPYHNYYAAPVPAIDVDEAMRLLRELLESRDAEAKANHSLDVARKNFTSWAPEERALVSAMTRASNAEKAARAALAAYLKGQR